MQCDLLSLLLLLIPEGTEVRGHLQDSTVGPDAVDSTGLTTEGRPALSRTLLIESGGLSLIFQQFNSSAKRVLILSCLENSLQSHLRCLESSFRAASLQRAAVKLIVLKAQIIMGP